MKPRLAALAAVLLAALSLPTAAEAATPTATTAAARVGPGWYLAQVDQGEQGPYGIEATQTRLVLVSPDGTRHRVLERSSRRAHWSLVDWSPDGSTALLVSRADRRPRVLRVDVADGTTRRLELPADAADIALAPGDTGVLVTSFDKDGRASLSTVAWDGARRVLLPEVSGPALASPDGSVLVTGGAGGRARVVRVVGATTGAIVRRIDTDARCQPVRWWAGDRVLARCTRGPHPTFLQIVNTRTGTVRQLTDRADRQPGDLGDLDARRIDSGLYLQIAGPCGYVYLGKQHRDGSVTKVDVPHASGNVVLLGGSGRWLVIQHAMSCDGSAPRSVIARFDPVTAREKVLTRLPRNEAFERVIAYGEPQPTGF